MRRFQATRLLTTAAFGAAVLAACATPTSVAPAAPRPTAAPAAVQPSLPTSPTGAAAAQAPAFDEQFIDVMVPHHEGALAMARLAQDRAERPEIRQMADDILRSQDAEISRMRQWRREWFGSDTTPPMTKMPMLGGMPGIAAHSGQTMDMAADVERLKSSSARFDIAFIDAMIPHHQSAIEASRLALQQATRPEIKDLALAIIEPSNARSVRCRTGD